MKFYLISRVLIENEKTFNLLKSKYKEILADLISAKDKPSCSCNNRIISFLEEKYKNQEDKKFIDSLIEDDSVKDVITEILNDDQEINQILNTPHLIKKEEGYYEKFLKFLVEKGADNYVRSLSVIDRGDSVEIFVFGYKQV